ncbi:hypothetical protein MY11210_003880 [Beauveria gryllotalpidicola]
MLKNATAYGALTLCLFVLAQTKPLSSTHTPTIHARETDTWPSTLSNDTRHRLDVARQHLNDNGAAGQAFRNDTMMRINIEREALDLPLVDLSQVFGMTLPASRASVAGVGVCKRSRDGDEREQQYLRSGTMTSLNRRGNTDDAYESLVNGNNLALGAVERINIAHRVLGHAEITAKQAKEIGSHGDEYVSNYWSSSMKHGHFWTTDQPAGKPNFIEGGQINGFGFIQSTFHKLHCLANLRMMLAWHITGNGGNMSRDMNVHAIHCLEYIRMRELANPDANEEPIDTVDYKGMGIH